MGLKDKLLPEPVEASAPDLEAGSSPDQASSRPPPFNPEHATAIHLHADEQVVPLAQTVDAGHSSRTIAQRERVEVHLHNSTNTFHNITLPSSRYPERHQVVIVQPQHESVCCPLLIFLLGFSMPVVWLLGCWYTDSPSRTLRLLGQMSVMLFLITAGSIIIAAFSIWDRTGRFPWEKH